MKKKSRAVSILLTVILFLLAIAFLAPLLWMVSSSLKSSMQVFEQPFHWIADRFRFDNYLAVWMAEEIPFWRLFGNSLLIAVVGVSGQLLIGSLAAYAFAKIEFLGKNLIFMIFMVTMMIPVQTMIIPRYVLFSTLNIYNTLWCIILPHFFNITTIFLLRQFYMALPDELVDAARVDGAGHFRIWWQVMMPLTKNGMISAAILAFINCWNEYLNPLIFISNQKLYTVSLGIRWYLHDIAQEYNLMMAAAASAVFPIIVVYVLAQKYFEEGIASGGVKG